MSHEPYEFKKKPLGEGRWIIEERRIIEVRKIPADKSAKNFYLFLLIAAILGILFSRC
jgi:hypothetical protein